MQKAKKHFLDLVSKRNIRQIEDDQAQDAEMLIAMQDAIKFAGLTQDERYALYYEIEEDLQR